MNYGGFLNYVLFEEFLTAVEYSNDWLDHVLTGKQNGVYFCFSLGPTLEPEEVVNKLIDGILTEQKMIFVPSSLNFLSLMEK